MIEEVPGHTLAHRFAHELVRRALYDRLAAGRRAELHLRIAEALDERASDGSARALGDVAHHFAAAAPIGGTDRAVEYSLLAAAARWWRWRSTRRRWRCGPRSSSGSRAAPTARTPCSTSGR